MAVTSKKIITGLRVLPALLLLLFNSIAPAVELMLPEPVTCGMVCCLERGICYCDSKSHSHSHGGKESQSHGHSAGDPDGLEASQTTEISTVRIVSSCPVQCAQLPAGFQKHSITRAQPHRLAFVAGIARRLFNHTPVLARDTLTVEAHAPRAPPITLL
jgi:hypothetical protein